LIEVITGEIPVFRNVKNVLPVLLYMGLHFIAFMVFLIFTRVGYLDVYLGDVKCVAKNISDIFFLK